MLCFRSAFLELSQLAGYRLYEDDVPCGGMITGIGTVCGFVFLFHFITQITLVLKLLISYPDILVMNEKFQIYIQDR